MSILKDLLPLITEARNTISFSDPDRDVGAVEREGAARDAMHAKQKASSSKWEALVKKLKGKVRFHRESDGLRSHEKPLITADIPGGFSIGEWRHTQLLEFETPISKDEHRNNIVRIWKKHGILRYPTDFYSMDGCPVTSFNAVVIGYYSSLEGEEGDAVVKATIETYKYISAVIKK